MYIFDTINNRGNCRKYSEFTVENLNKWQKGVSGNPKGRPKGSRNIKKIIQNLLLDRDTYKRLPIDAPQDTQTPLEAIICSLMVKSMAGDVRASEVLLKYAVDRNEATEDDGFFSQGRLIIEVVDSHGNALHTNNELKVVEGKAINL